MKLQEFLNKAGTLLGVAEKGLPDESKLVALETLLKETESKLSTAEAVVADLNSKLSESNAALVKSTEEISNLKAEVETTKASVEKLASAKALERKEFFAGLCIPHDEIVADRNNRFFIG